MAMFGPIRLGGGLLVAALLCSCGGSGGSGGSTVDDVEPPKENEAPIAVASASSTNGEAPLLVDFSASDSVDPEGEEMTFTWEFGDGSPVAAGQAVSHTYSVEGNYAAVLTALDSAGLPGTDQVLISVGAATCPAFAQGVGVGNVESSALLEASGIAPSRKNPGVLWVNNDSGDSARLFAMTEEARHLGIYNIVGASAYDWEDIAVGPGPEAGAHYIYVADIGDNAKARAYVVVYRVPEPAVDPGSPAGTQDVAGAVRLEMVYPEGPSDAEAMFVDPRTSDIFIVTKRSDGNSRVYRNPAPQTGGVRVTMDLVATLSFGTAELPGSTLVTAADASPLGNWILLKTYSNAYLWLRGQESVGQALQGAACPVPLRSEGQGEAIGFRWNGDGYYTVSEGTNPPLYRFALSGSP
jgi:PKD repeat protein